MKLHCVTRSNTCPSPMAKAFSNEGARRRGLKATAQGAGLDVYEKQVSDEAIAVMKEAGVLLVHTPQ